MKILKDGITYIFGDILSRMIPFLMLPYLTRKLGVSGYGELSIALSLIAVTVIFINMGQDGALPKSFFRYGENTAKSVFKIGLVYGIVCSIVLLPFFLFIDYGYIFLFCALIQVCFAQCLIYLQCQKKSSQYVKFQLAFGVLSSLITILLFEFVDISIVARLLSLFIANTILFVIILKKLGIKLTVEKSKQKNDKLAFSFIFAFGWPLLINQIATYAKGQFDRVYLAKYFSSADIGVYAAAFQLSYIAMVIFLSLNKATIPYYFEALKKGIIKKSNIYQIIFAGITAYCLLVIIVFLIPDSLITLILGEAFSQAPHYAKIFILGIGINIPYLLLANYYLYIGNTKVIALVNVISATVYVLSLILLKDKGIEYVPYSLVISNLVLFLLLFSHFYRRKNI